MFDLDDFKNSFEIISSSQMTKQDRNIKLATLMTKMEKHFKIPTLNDDDFNAKNEEIIALYRKISDARFN